MEANNKFFYQKSLEIFKLSREVASYITDGKNMLEMQYSKQHIDRYADSLVMNSLGLIPKVMEAESEENPKLKLKYVKALRYFVDRIYFDCLRLEKAIRQGSDFVKMLRFELKKFRKAHSFYVSSLH